MKPINVGLLGIGTVGGGTFAVLKRNQEEIARRAGRDIVIRMIADRDIEKARKIAGDEVTVTGDANEVVTNPDIDIVVELIGGYTVAKELILKAIENGKHVITANKALLASHGTEIFAAAQRKGVMVAFEAAVAGGIPIIKALREGLTANRIEWIAGIINGTSNYILSEMRDKGLTFDTVLKQAQKLGYAEADPTFDIEGIDAAHKLTIMAAIAFGIPMQFDKAYTEGITKLTREDIRYAEELGYRIKLLGHHQAHAQGHRIARPSDADPHPPSDCERGGCHECRCGEGRRSRRDLILRGGRRGRTDSQFRRGRPGGCHPDAHRRSPASRSSSRISTRSPVQYTDIADG